VVFSYVKIRWLDASWVGREFDNQVIADLCALREQNGLDLCGEEGEYHTLVTDAPGFKRRLHLDVFRVCERKDLAYLEIDRAELKAKP
jgi:diphthine-ammonia ligase